MKNTDTITKSMEIGYTSTQAPETSYIFLERGGLQRIRYVDIDGNAYTQGDIYLGKTDALRAIKQIVDVERRNPGPEAIIGIGPISGRRWTGGVVPFVVQPGLQLAVNPAIAAWQSKTPVRFVPRSTQGDFVSFESGAGCKSYVGMQGGKQVITLGFGCGSGQAMHEIGHALGLWHEQSRADRDQYVVIHYENIDPTDKSEFDTVGSEGMDVGPYDYDSIMHYGPYDFSQNGRMTIEPKVPGVTIGQRTHLSPGDIAAVTNAYRDGSSWRGLPGWASDVGAGGGKIWVTGGNDGIFRWTGSTWEGFPGNAYRVAVDGSGLAWVVNRQGQIFRWTGGAWQGLPGWASDIAVGGPPASPSVWVIGSGGGIYRWNGTDWDGMPGNAQKIAVGADGNAWVANSNGEIFRWTGATWQGLPGWASDIGVGGDPSAPSSWVIGGNGAIFRWTDTGWRAIEGQAQWITVGQDGLPIVVNSSGEIYMRV